MDIDKFGKSAFMQNENILRYFCCSSRIVFVLKTELRSTFTAGSFLSWKVENCFMQL